MITSVNPESHTDAKELTLRMINEDQGSYPSKQAPTRSRKGCLTCKCRKKKCDEERPICSDCKRLGRECIWTHPQMTYKHIQTLRDKILNDEQRLTRPRKRKKLNDNDINVGQNIPFPLSASKFDLISLDKIPNQSINLPTLESHYLNSDCLAVPEDILAVNIFGSNTNLVTAYPSHRAVNCGNAHIGSKVETDQDEATRQMKALKNNGAQSEDPFDLHVHRSALVDTLDPSNCAPPRVPSFSGTFDIFNQIDERFDSFKSFDTNQNFSNSFLDLQSLTSLSKIDSTAFLNLLTDLKNYDPKLQLVEDINIDAEDKEYPNTVADLTPTSYDHLVDEIQTIMTPLSAREPSYIPALSSSTTANYLYTYYEQVLSKHVSISPRSQNESNSYQKVFLPLAHKDAGVLYAILGWAGYHLGGEWVKEGTKYTKLASNHLSKSMFGIENYRDSPFKFKASKEYALSNCCEDKQSIMTKLATLLILCGSEICRGDVKHWSTNLSWCWKILDANGGILRFNTSKEGHWLLSNFAYHDLLSSSSNERGTYFPSDQYDVIFKDKDGYSRGNLSPLLGVSKELFKIIGDISTLVYDSRNNIDLYFKKEEYPKIWEIESDQEVLKSVIEKGLNLEKKIQACKPESKDLIGLTEQELDLQLTLFKAFQLSAKLFLRQSVLKCNPSTLKNQVLNNDLIKCIDILVGSDVQSSLVFPVFIAGIHCVSRRDREVMTERMNNFIKLYGPWNLSRAKFLVEKVWEVNPQGNSVIDWYSILKQLNWDINFA